MIVPLERARDREACQRQIKRLCEPERSCFINFDTNSSGAALTEGKKVWWVTG